MLSGAEWVCRVRAVSAAGRGPRQPRSGPGTPPTGDWMPDVKLRAVVKRAMAANHMAGGDAHMHAGGPGTGYLGLP